MDKLKNKNTIVLIISAVLILIAIIVAVVATASSNSDKKEDPKTTTEEGVSIDLASIADINNTDKNNKKDKDNTADPSAPVQSTKPATENNSYVNKTGKYKVATKDDPLGLRLEPNTDSDRIIYVPKGYEVEVIAVWEDWGYVVYEQTGGWLSMNYLELVSGSKKAETKTTTAAEQ